jgi:hypothetical protein
MGRRTKLLLAVAIAIGTAIGIAIGPAVWEWNAIDVCLDRGGCWDKVHRACEHENPVNCGR